jgi:glycosyltransferase involved in cell wall biosynthesis
MITYHHVEGLSKRGHALTLVLPLRRPEDAASAARLEERARVRAVRVTTKATFRAAAEGLARNTSFRIARHEFSEVAREMTSALSEKPDLVFLDSLFTAYLLPVVRRVSNVPVVLLEHNVESRVFERLVQNTGSARWRFLSLWESARIGAAERRAADAASRVLTLSQEDADAIAALAPQSKTAVCGPGIPTYPGETILAPSERETVLFLASYLWPPNVDGAEWLVRSVWPRVREFLPTARLVLAGPDPGGRIRRLTNRQLSIEAPGFVEDAVATTRAAGVAVAPLRVGGGVRLKILEALANERPLVTTSLGAEGLGLIDDMHALFADTAERFAEAIVGLLQDAGAAQRLAREGRAFVEERYSWEIALSRLERILSATVHEASS